MNQSDAASVLGFLNAAFPRDALEPESAAIWVSEIMELPHAQAALDAAKRVGREGDRFPTLKEFRTAYRQAFDRHMAGRELEAPVDAVPPPPEFLATWEQIQSGLPYGWGPDGRFHTRHTAIPETTSMKARPVWERHERRDELRELLPPSAAEIHDAILVLRDHQPDDETYVGTALHMEAFRILDGCGAA